MAKTSTSAGSDVAVFRRRLNAWYRLNGRHGLSWRQTRDPYAVLVSEVMLQQTQVDRVLPYYEAWMRRWPDFGALAAAPLADVIRAWSGLGYNRRAVALHRLAQKLAAKGEELPAATEELLRLPGIGPYTASAIQCFAREQRATPADTNIARVLARAILGAASNRGVPPAQLQSAAEVILPARNARDHNLALMDLGALICSARNPGCERCPVASLCAWRCAGGPAASVSAVAESAPPFESTARFARGRLVEALRSGPLDECALRELLPPPHRERLDRYLGALERDGLVRQQDDGAWSLP